MRYVLDFCLIVGFVVTCMLTSRAFRFSATQTDQEVFIKFEDSSFGYLWLVAQWWVFFLLAFGFSFMSGLAGSHFSVYIFTFILVFLISINIRKLWQWVFNANPYYHFLEGFILTCVFWSLVRQKSFSDMRRFLSQNISKKKSALQFLSEILGRIHEQLQHGEPAEIKKFMDLLARYRPVMGATRKASSQSTEENIIDLQKNFVIAFFITLVITLLGFTGIAWNLHILDKYQLITKEGTVVSDFLSYLYFTVITVSTVGYGDIVPGNTFAKAFSIIEILTGFFLIVLVLSSFANVTIRLYRIPVKYKNPSDKSKDKKKTTE